MVKANYARILIHACFIIFCLLCIIPLAAIIGISLSNETDINTLGYHIIPPNIDFSGYIYVLNQPKQILNAYKVSIAVCLVGTALSLMLTAGLAYTLSRRDFQLRKPVNFFVFFTLLFNGGLVPWYILITNYLHLKNTFWVMILPYAVLPWFVFLLRTFMSKIPHEIVESCSIDGASEFRIFFQMILPLSKPGLATIGLLTVLQFWNDWWLSLLFIEKEHLVPLQFMLYRIMSTIEFLTNSSNAMPANMQTGVLPQESARMAMAVLAAGPMLFVFPFFQQYFVKGLTVGSIKG